MKRNTFVCALKNTSADPEIQVWLLLWIMKYKCESFCVHVCIMRLFWAHRWQPKIPLYLYLRIDLLEFSDWLVLWHICNAVTTWASRQAKLSAHRVERSSEGERECAAVCLRTEQEFYERKYISLCSNIFKCALNNIFYAEHVSLRAQDRGTNITPSFHQTVSERRSKTHCWYDNNLVLNTQASC